MEEQREARILVWDIETSPMISYNWSAYQSDALEVIEEPQILCFAYKWLGDKKVKVLGQDDFKPFKPGILNDKLLVTEIHRLFNEADIIVAHNGDSFDQKTAQSRMMVWGLTPPSPYKQIDTKKVLKKYGRFSKNNLTNICNQFGLGVKTANEGWDMWKKVLQGNKKAWKQMKEYNKHDVELEEKLYLKLRPWIQNHPSVALIGDIPEACPKCSGEKFRRGGFTYTNTGRRKRYQCLSCGGWVSGRLIGGNKPEYIN